ncbi:MAG TPA: serine hydrolase [Pseudonocardia sp.]|nr:serine hydrolase [Pseudonocardia sp.]
MTRTCGALVALATVLALLVGCGPAATATRPAPAGDLAERIEAFLGADAPGPDDPRRAVLVDVGGELRYVRGDPASRGNVRSVTKSVLATLIGIAVDDGRIAGVDRTLGELLPDHAPVMPGPMRAATLRQVLTMTAGAVADRPADASPPDPAEDWARRALTLGPQTPPGTFVYSTTGSHLLSAVLTEATGMSARDYARRELFGPLGIDVPGPGVAWKADPQGRQLGGTGLHLGAADMLALGRLYRAGGRWNGEQLVSAAWVAEATRPHVRTGGGLAGYGYQWWTTTADGHPAFVAAGSGGQLIEVVPDLDLVVVVRNEVGDGPAARSPDYPRLVDSVIAPAIDRG